MLLKSKSSHTVGIGYDPRIRFGARTLPRPRLTLAADASTTFNGLYMRPNFDNGGTVPATGSLCTYPDIWIAGTTPPYYRMASHNVHANPKGVFFKLGLVEQREILLAGPSDVGLADPGYATALSLMQISTALVHLNPSFDNELITKIMLALANEIGAAFAASHAQSKR
jgi:hypothetical protein